MIASTASFAGQILSDILEFSQQIVVRIVPDLGEFPFTHITERDVLPELARMNLAVRVNTGELATGRTPAVAHQQIAHFVRALGLMLANVLFDQDAVRVIVRSQNLRCDTAFVPIKRSIDQALNHPATLVFSEILIHQFPSSPRVNEMVQTEPGHPFPLDEIEDTVEIGEIVLGNREPYTDLEPDFNAVAQTVDRLPERFTIPPEPVMPFRQTIKTDPNVLEAGITRPRRDVPGDQRTVRR
jgi:hypothetical protein